MSSPVFKNFTLWRVLLFAVLLILWLAFAILIASRASNNSITYYDISWDAKKSISSLVKQAKSDTSDVDTFLSYSYTQKFKISKKSHKVLYPKWYKNKKNKLIKSKVLALNNLLLNSYTLNNSEKADSFLLNISSIDYDQFSLSELMKFCKCDNEERTSYSLPIALIDSGLPLRYYKGTLNLHLKSYTDPHNYYLKYPKIGIWFYLFFSQTIIYLLFIPLLLYCIFWKQPMILFFEHKENDNYIYYGFFVPFITIIICTFLCYVLFYIFHEYKNGFNSCSWFYSEQRDVVSMVKYFGYFATSLCLSGFVLCIYQTKLLKAYESNDKTSDIINLKLGYMQIKRMINLYRVIAIVLLLSTLITCLMYIYALNDIDFFRFLSKDRQKTAIPYDFILIYGITHIIVYVFFYMLAKYALKSLPKRFKLVVEQVL